MTASNSNRVRRSVHFVPGANEKMLEKAIDSEADTLVLDLEDSVAPTEKNQARQTIADWLRDVDFKTKEIAVRINPIDTPWGLFDIESMMVNPPDLLMIPKAERVSDLHVIESEIAKWENFNNPATAPVKWLLIANETARGVVQLFNVASEPRVEAVTWGAEDLATSVGATRNRADGGTYLSMFESCRFQTVYAARTFDVQPIDTVYVKLNDEKGLREDCKIASEMGFTGKLTIHPNQIPWVNEAFSPSAEEIARAECMVEAFKEAQEEGKLAFRFEGQMVDAPHLANAKGLLERAAKIGAK